MIRALLIAVLRHRASALALAIVDLMITDPEGWERDEYYLVHKTSRLSIWVANRVYGLEIEVIRALSYRMKYVDRKLIWMHAKQFKWIDPTPDQIIERINQSRQDGFSASHPILHRVK